MPRDLTYGNRFPKPLNAPGTGDPKADAALLKMQGYEVNPYSPVPVPTGEDYPATRKRAESIGPERLLALLDGAAVQSGESRWSDDWVDKLERGERRAFKKHYDAVVQAIANRNAYLNWLMRAVVGIDAGLERVVEIAAGAGATAARLTAAKVLIDEARSDSHLRRVGEGIDLLAWDGKSNLLERVYLAGPLCLSSVEPGRAYQRYRGLLEPAPLKRQPGRNRANALLLGLGYARQLDPRWQGAVLPLLEAEGALELNALHVLAALPHDPGLLEPLLAYAAKTTYWYDATVTLLARTADPRAAPHLQAALESNWQHYPAALEGLRLAGDPSVVPFLRAWLEANGDGPEGERTRLCSAAIRHLEARGPTRPRGA